MIETVHREKTKIVPECEKCTSSCGRNDSFDMDDLTHAIEGYITAGAWKLSDMFHLKAIEII